MVQNGCSASTTFVWKRVKITAPPRPQGTARAKRAPRAPAERSERAKQRALRNVAGVLVQYRGGPECWWEITYAGDRYRFPGYIQIHDALAHVLGGCECHS